MQIESSFGDWLKRRRRALDLTREELAQQVGCSAATIRKIEADERRPSKQIAARLAECLEVPREEQAAFVTFARTDPYTTPMAPPPSPVAAPLPWRSPTGPGSHLPTPLTRLIGREQVVAAARSSLLQAEARLLTLIGPPGIGKTRLCLQLAAELAAAFEDGVTFVALAPLTDPGLMVVTIAQALGFKESAGQPLLTRLITFLRDKKMLLALDNFEQLLEVAPLLAQLLEACPGLKLLVTSRAALRVRGEWQFPVPPLLLPNLEALPPLEAISSYPAITLFVERAQALDPAFVLNEANAAAVAAICARLDGLPLAIELAAAWSQLLPPAELLARLKSRLDMLTGGPLDLPARHRTLRAAITWSYDLLEPWEQTLFARLAVFSGGCTLATAEAICSEVRFEPDEGSPVQPKTIKVLAGLASLVNKSLLVQQEGTAGQSRFMMLETIREFAWERLGESGELEALRRQHSAYYTELAVMAEPKLRESEQQLWLERLEGEHNNLRAVLSWALDHQETEIALRLSGTIWRFWELHSHLSEGRKWLAAALAQSDRQMQAQREGSSRAYLAARAKALNGAGKLANNQGDSTTARALGEASLALWQALGVEGERGSLTTLNSLGVAAQSQGDYSRAIELHTACLELARRVGDRAGIYLALFNLAELAMAQGDDKQALRLHEESLALKWEQGDLWSIAWSLSSLALLATQQGDFGRVAALQQESLKLRWQLGDKWGTAESLAGLAGAASETGQTERAARLFGAVQALLRAIGASLSPQAQAHYERQLAMTRAQLAEPAFEAAWAEGQAMPLAEVIAYALP